MMLSKTQLRQFICDMMNLFEGHTHAGCDDSTQSSAQYGGYGICLEHGMEARMRRMGIVRNAEYLGDYDWIPYEEAKHCPLCRNEGIEIKHPQINWQLPEILCENCHKEGRTRVAWQTNDETFEKRKQDYQREERDG